MIIKYIYKLIDTWGGQVKYTSEIDEIFLEYY